MTASANEVNGMDDIAMQLSPLISVKDSNAEWKGARLVFITAFFGLLWVTHIFVLRISMFQDNELQRRRSHFPPSGNPEERRPTSSSCSWSFVLRKTPQILPRNSLRVSFVSIS